MFICLSADPYVAMYAPGRYFWKFAVTFIAHSLYFRETRVHFVVTLYTWPHILKRNGLSCALLSSWRKCIIRCAAHPKHHLPGRLLLNYPHAPSAWSLYPPARSSPCWPARRTGFNRISKRHLPMVSHEKHNFSFLLKKVFSTLRSWLHSRIKFCPLTLKYCSCNFPI